VIPLGMFAGVGVVAPGPGPGGSYAYWSPTDKPAGITLSDSDKVATGTGVAVAPLRSITARARGKWYVEFVIENFVNSLGVGFASRVAAIAPYLGAGMYSFSLFGNYSSQVRAFHLGSAINSWTPPTPYTTGDVVGMHIDYDAGKAWFAKNGTAISGDPAAGTGAMITFSPNIPMCLAANPYGNSASGGAVRLRTDPAEHDYSAASGFTAGFPEIDPDVQVLDPYYCTLACYYPADNAVESFASIGNYANARALKPCAGLCYFSMSVDWNGSGSVAGAGVADETSDLRNSNNYPGYDNMGVEVGCPNGSMFHNAGSVGTLPGTITNDPVNIEFAVDVSTRKVWIRQNGQAWAGGGDPAAGTSPTVTLSGSGAIYPVGWISTSGPSGRQVALHVDAGSTTGTPPSGFTAANWA
jgi:hypothetical protein